MIARAGLAAVAVAASAWAAPSVDVSIEDAAPHHVHAAGEPFAVRVRIDQPGVSVRWTDFRGRPLSPPRKLEPGRTVPISAPSGDPGFYDLEFSSSGAVLPRRTRPGETLSYGFVIAPKTSGRVWNPASRLGMCKPLMAGPWPGDPLIDSAVVGWIKSLYWQSTGADFWASEIARRRKAGLEELPLVEGGNWPSDDTKPIGDAQLAAIREQFRSLIAADPTVEIWELGREENLGEKFQQPFYFENLAKKARVCAGTARAAGVKNFRAVYNIADATWTGNVARFLASPAVAQFQILSLHPYPWNPAPSRDYPDPETWLPKFLADVRASMEKTGRSLPIWFTEAGAPVQETAPDVPFGYSPYTSHDNGVSRAASADYLLKLHALGFALGVEKIFWYEYADSGGNPQEAEHVFGLVDASGFPRPAYATYLLLCRFFNRCVPASVPYRCSPDGVHVCEFRVDAAPLADRLLVVWSDKKREVSLASLAKGLTAVRKIFFVDGRPLPVPRTGKINLDSSPRVLVAPSS